MRKIKEGFLLVLVALIALVLLGSVVFGQVGDAKYNLEGYSREMAKWTRGNLKGWLENNWVPYRLRMEIVAYGYFEVTIQHDSVWTGSGGPNPGVDNCKSEPGNPFYGKPLFWDEPHSTNFWVGDESGVLLPIPVTTTRILDLVESNTIVIQFTSKFTVPSGYVGRVIYLYWMAHLAIGSSEWSGASLHAHTTATGSQDVPIAIPPSGKVYGHKYFDYNCNGIVPDDGDYPIADWPIHLKGTYLGSTITWDKLTDANGYYEFGGLPDGTWTLTEDLRTAEGWFQTTFSTYTVTVSGGKTKGPYDFGNFLLTPAIDVVKSGPTLAHEKDTIKYTITVSNAGNCPLSSVTLTDTLLGPIDGTFSLAVGETKTFYVDYTIPLGAADPLKNTVTANGYDELGRMVTDSASWSVDLIHPSIDVQKSGVAMAHEGDVITYTITVKNTGDTALSGVTVVDNVLGSIFSGSLAPGETKTFTVTYTVPVGGADPIANTVTASGKDVLGKIVTDSASWSVDILHPAIDVAKSGPNFAHEGDTITYTITVRNTGDCPLTGVKVVDTLLGDLTGRLPDDTLAVGETNTFAVTYTVPTPQVLDVKNTVTASGNDALGKSVSDTASWSVDILHPAIKVEKTGPTFAHEGDTITYTITVRNMGDCPLYSVKVIDTLLGDLTTRLPDNTLDVGEVNTFTVTYKVPVPQVLNVDNTVTASGKDALNFSVSSSASWSVDILHPKIDVEKSGPATAHEGETITYTITVRDLGDCPLYSVNVIDTLLGDLTARLPDNTLDVGEVNIFTVTYTVPVCAGTPSKIVNTVTGSGTDILGWTVSDAASWTFDVILPYPPVAMFTEDPVEPLVGQTVTFNASMSKPGFDGWDVCPITEYRWDFDGDGKVDLVSDKPVVTFIFRAAGDYNVALTVYAPPGPRGLGCYDPYDTTWHIKRVSPPVGGSAVPIEDVEGSSLGIYIAFAASAVVLISALVWTRHRSGSRRKASKFLQQK